MSVKFTTLKFKGAKICEAFSLSLSLSLACFSVSFAWGEEPTKKVIDCTTEICGTSKGESKFFALPTYFHNVDINNFTNNGAMTFKNPVYFSANDKDTDLNNRATFTNNGLMTFESNAMFQKLINKGILNLNANADLDFIDDGSYISFNGDVLNEGRVNVNGMIRFDKVIDNTGKFYIHNNTLFENASRNYASGLFVIERPTIVTYWLNNQDGATLHIKGTTLTINAAVNDKVGQGEFWNFRGATLIFSAVNGRLGQLIGDFINYAYKNDTSKDEGKVKINVRGLSAGTKYQIIDGTTILLNGKDIEFINGTGRYDNGWIWIEEVFAPKIFLTLNQQVIKKVLESKLVSMNDSDIVQAVLDTETMLKTSVITQPTNMLKAFKADTLNAPLNSAYVTRLTASSASIMSDASSFANPLEKASQTQFFATPFGGVLKGDDLSGHLLGLSVGLTHIDDDYIAQGHFAYANGTSTQDLQTQSTQINGNLFQVGGFGRLFYDKLETDINANFIFAKFSLDNTWLDNALNSSSNFNNYQINLGAVAGWRFGDDLSVKPFAGLQTYYENQGEFKQDMLNLTSEAYSALVMDAFVGVEGRYVFENGGFAFAKASYENKLYNSHKEVFMRVGTEALRYENESYDNVASLNLGARVLATKALKLDIEGLYKHYDNGIDYLGANLSVRLSF